VLCGRSITGSAFKGFHDQHYPQCSVHKTTIRVTQTHQIIIHQEIWNNALNGGGRRNNTDSDSRYLSFESIGIVTELTRNLTTVLRAPACLQGRFFPRVIITEYGVLRTDFPVGAGVCTLCHHRYQCCWQ
jgi:hypothetical protein